MERSRELMERLLAQRFRTRRQALASELSSLLGGRLAPQPLADAHRAASLWDAFRDSCEAAQRADRPRIEKSWDAAEPASLIEMLHGVARNLGLRAAWLLTCPSEVEPAQAVALDVSAVLDNPLGFAAPTDHELRLLDAQAPAGLWLVRHSHHYGTARVEYSWELEIWGEPWLVSATRALHGIG